jgi:hypothetical protein
LLLGLPLGCGGGSPVFETIDAPPKAEESNHLEEVAVPALVMAPAARPYEDLLRRLFLALSHADRQQLAEILTQDALLRRGSGASSDPALSELLTVSLGADAEGGDAKTGAISHYNIRELVPRDSPPLAVVDVFGTDPWAGTWRIRFAAGQNPRIAEITIPAAQ